MILLMERDEKRLEVVQHVLSGSMELSKGAEVLGISLRQFYRLKFSVKSKGARGVIHGNRGNKHALKYDKAFKERVLGIIRKSYLNINDSQLCELLRKRESIEVSRQSLRMLLRSSGIAAKQKRRSKKYRSRRDRKAAFGAMIQMDASIHDWLEGRGARMTLVGGIDDATGYVWASFEKSENTWAYLRVLHEIVLKHGIPLSIYTDRHTLFHSPKEPSIIEQFQNTHSLTQVGRACRDLNIEMIKAYSPQAKGRIERLWGTFQDRLVVEMRLAGIRNKEAANLFLKAFLKEYNQRFTVKAKDKEPVFRKRPGLLELERTLCLKETRTVKKDHTVSFEGLSIQIPPSSKWASIANQKAEVLQLENGTIEIWYKKQRVHTLSKQRINDLIKKYQIKKTELKNAA